MLYLKASEYSREDSKAFANLFGKSSRAVLQECASIEKVATLPFDELVEFIDAALEEEQKRVGVAISEAMQAIPNTLDTIPGFGPVLSDGIIAETGHVERFDYDQDNVAKFAGLCWRHSGSADFQAEETPQTRTGNPICVTTSAKPHSRFRGAIEHMLLSSRKSMPKPASIATNALRSSLLVSWSDWLFIY